MMQLLEVLGMNEALVLNHWHCILNWVSDVRLFLSV